MTGVREVAARAVIALLALVLALVLALPPLAGQDASSRAGGRPDIVLLLSDDHAAHALSAYRPHLDYGARLPETRRLDALAAEGALFTHAFVTNSICAPSRATILTGQYGHLNGVMTNQVRHPLENTFPELLRAAGYETALFGKWHLDEVPRGFDHWEVLQGQGPYWNPVLVGPEGERAYRGYTSDIVVDRALRWLERRDDPERPVLLLVHFNAAHRWWDPGPLELGLFRDTVIPEPATLWDRGEGRASPAREQEMEILRDLFDRDLKLGTPSGLDLDPEQAALWESAYGEENRAFLEAGHEGPDLLRWRYQRFIGDYLRTVAGLDRNVGRVLDGLEALGLGDAAVVYTSDQGFFLGDHGWFDKRWMYEESLRTPLLVRWPGVVGAGTVEDALVMNLDLAPTFLELGGADVPASVQGRSLVPLLRGEEPEWRDAVYYQYFAYPDWHMVQRQYGVRTRRHKLIHFYETGEWELYDLARDPEELRSVYGHPDYREVEERLRQRLRTLRERYRVPEEDPVPRTPFDPPPHLRRDAAHPGE